MNRPPAEEYGKGEGSLRPIDELLKKPHDTNLYPNLIEDYYNLADKDIHLAELYRLAATSQDERFVPNPVQTAKIDGELWVDVLAEIKDKTDLSQLRDIMEVHSYTRRFVSGRVLVQRLPELSYLVKRLQTARPIHATLDTSVESIQADLDSLTQRFSVIGSSSVPTGKNVIIGIIDTGCDYLHPNFRDDEGNSRILYFWDQKGAPKTASLPYGREYDQTTLTQMIQDNVNKTYDGLNYQPDKNAHGTHVMDIAAGNSTKYPGIAPEADLIFVHLGLPSPIEVEKEFLGSSKKLYEAVKYIFDKADMEGKPAVVNISLASNGGPHDGTSLLERMFDDLLDDKGGRAIVIAAGNSYKDGIHTKGSIESTTVSDFHWTINQHVSLNNPSNWGQRQEMEIWYESQDSLVLDVYDPKDQLIGSCERDDPPLEMSVADFPEPTILIYHSFDEEANENHINVFIDDRYSGLELGDYRFQLKPPATSLTNAVEYHAWIEENKVYPSKFAKDDQESSVTINSIANAKLPIVVGAYNNEDAAKPIYLGSSSGPSRNSDALDKPEISAPGKKIFAARSHHYGSEDGIDKDGTSQAAPHVSGVIALMFETARDFCNPPKELNISQIRQILIDTADRDPPQGTHETHDPQYGFGRINCSEALNQVLA